VPSGFAANVEGNMELEIGIFKENRNLAAYLSKKIIGKLRRKDRCKHN
jgi:hypothetical protein